MIRSREREAILALSAERDAWLARCLAAEAYGYARGRAAGYGHGVAVTLERAAADQRRAADHLQATGVPDTELMIRRYGPPGWPGMIPAGMDSARARRWLAALPRAGDRKPATA